MGLKRIPENFVLEEDQDKDLEDFNPFDINDSGDEDIDLSDDPDNEKKEIDIDDIPKLITIFDNFEQREEKILGKKPRVVEVPRVREARVREGVLYSIRYCRLHNISLSSYLVLLV